MAAQIDLKKLQEVISFATKEIQDIRSYADQTGGELDEERISTLSEKLKILVDTFINQKAQAEHEEGISSIIQDIMDRKKNAEAREEAREKNKNSYPETLQPTQKEKKEDADQDVQRDYFDAENELRYGRYNMFTDNLDMKIDEPFNEMDAPTKVLLRNSFLHDVVRSADAIPPFGEANLTGKVARSFKDLIGNKLYTGTSSDPNHLARILQALYSTIKANKLNEGAAYLLLESAMKPDCSAEFIVSSSKDTNYTLRDCIVCLQQTAASVSNNAVVAQRNIDEILNTEPTQDIAEILANLLKQTRLLHSNEFHPKKRAFKVENSFLQSVEVLLRRFYPYSANNILQSLAWSQEVGHRELMSLKSENKPLSDARFNFNQTVSLIAICCRELQDLRPTSQWSTQSRPTVERTEKNTQFRRNPGPPRRYPVAEIHEDPEASSEPNENQGEKEIEEEILALEAKKTALIQKRQKSPWCWTCGDPGHLSNACQDPPQPRSDTKCELCQMNHAGRCYLDKQK